MSQLSNNDKANATPSDAPTLCRNCCEFFGNKHCDNLCSKCFKEKCKAEDNAVSLLSGSVATEVKEIAPVVSKIIESIPVQVEAVKVEPEAEKPKPVEKESNKCAKCSKKVGVLGHKCKCGSTYCKGHRLPEDHDCEYDFKQEGLKKLAKDNQAVVASKLAKI